MFSSDTLHRALIVVNAVAAGPSHSTLAPANEEQHLLLSPNSTVTAPCKPRKGQVHVVSPLRPAVLACDQLLHWTTPFAISRSSSLLVIPRADAQTLTAVMLSSLDPKTQ